MGQGVMSLRLCWARWKRASYQIAYYKAQTIIGRLSLPIGVESVNTNSISKQVLESLKTGEEYRHSFVEEKVKTKIASQILAIRNQRGMDYKTFAQQLGKKTAWAYRLEDPNAGAPTISTLLGVARAFDVDLEVRFRPFSKLITEIDNLSSEPLAVPSFTEEIANSRSNDCLRASGVIVMPSAQKRQESIAIQSNVEQRDDANPIPKPSLGVAASQAEDLSA